MNSKIHKLLTIVAALLLPATFLAFQRGGDAETRYRDALHKQQVEGDLNGAITIYREIIASANASRAVKARALLQLATSLETLGQQAQTVYERLIREFDGEPAASQAKVRLAALKPPDVPQKMVTLIEFGPGIQYVEATDGQRVVYWNADRTTLLIGDKTGKTKTEIFKTTANRRPRVEVSRDLSMAFLFFTPTENKAEESYAVIRTDGSGTYREVTWPEQGNPGSMPPLYGVYWSFDNRYILVCKMNAGDRLGHVLKLSVDGGQIEEVRTAQAMDFVNAAPSPDGRSIALQVRNGGIFLMPAQGGKLELVTSDGAVADWTQDGSHLVYGAFEKEVFSLFAVPVTDSRVGGARIYLRGVAATQITRPVTTGSSLTFMHTDVNPNSQQVYHASLGADGKLSPWTALKTIGIGNPYAVWSPDDTRFAYISRAPNNRTTVIRVYTLATNDDRELFRLDERILNCLWAARPAVIYCSQPRRDAKTDILAIDDQTGRSEIVATFEGVRTIHALSPDDRILYMANLSGPTPWPRWEIGADQEVPGPSENTGFTSDDQRWIARPSSDATGRREYQIRPNGQEGEWRAMMPIRKQAPVVTGPIPAMFTRDGNWIVIHNLDEAGKDTLYRMPTAGGEPEALGTYPTDRPNSYLRVSHDGRQFLVGVMPTPSGESVAPAVWQLQNFIPAAATAKR